MPIKHAFTSAKSDGADATLVRPSNWNANHDIDYVDIPEAAAPGTPSSGNVRLYAKTDGNLYQKDDAGTETGLAGGGGGAPTSAKYVTTATDGTLSAEVVIPGFGSHPDIRVAGTNDDEFDTTDTTDPMTGWTTLGTPTTHDMNSTALSHYYVKQNATASTSWVGIYKANPSIPFTVTAKLASSFARANYSSAGLFVGQATPGNMLVLLRGHNTTPGIIADELFTNPTTFSTQYTSFTGYALGPVWLRIVVTASTNIACYYSLDGLLFTTLETGRNPGFTVGSVGLACKTENATYAQEAMFDWIRFT